MKHKQLFHFEIQRPTPYFPERTTDSRDLARIPSISTVWKRVLLAHSSVDLALLTSAYQSNPYPDLALFCAG